jgi:hypothetical protein
MEKNLLNYMGLLSVLRRFVIRRIQANLEPANRELDATLDEIERRGETMTLTDEEWAEILKTQNTLERNEMATEQSRERLRRFARLAGRKLE